jgi:catechol 2,3-dioxygenase-like lactoylglutathione lyase family enzyme
VRFPCFGDSTTVRGVIDHLSLQVADVGAAAEFYTRVFAPLGVRETMRHGSPDGEVVGLCGPDGFPRLWLGPLVDDGARPVHLALRSPSRAAVDEVFRLAREAGAEILHEPRVWPEYHAGYYGVFFRDPDGNNVEAVHHTFPASS